MRRGIAWLAGLLGMLALTPAAAAGAPVLNEVNCEATDWVELVNPSSDPVDLGGWLLTDDPVDGTRTDHRLVFPADTTIAAQGKLLVRKGAAGFPFGVKCGEDTIRLASPESVVADEVVVPVLPPQRPADGAGVTTAPGSSASPSATTGRSMPRARLAVRRFQVGRTRLVTTMRVAGAGVVTQTVVAEGGVTACRARAMTRRGGTLTLRCRFTRALLGARGGRPLPARVRTRFVPVDGASVTRDHALVLARPGQATATSASGWTATVQLRPRSFAE